MVYNVWIVENFSKEATEARNYEKKKLLLTSKIPPIFFFQTRLLGEYIEQKFHILIKTANDKKYYTNRNKAKDINKYIKNINDQ